MAAIRKPAPSTDPETAPGATTDGADSTDSADGDEETGEVQAAARLGEGDIAPDFALVDQDGATVSLSQFRGRKVVLYFYPAASTPGCTTQACDFRDNLAELNDAGLAVVGISPDLPAKLAKFRDAQGLTFPLLSDPDRAVLQAFGAYGEKKMYGKTSLGVIRSTFVIGPSGLVEKAMYNVKATGHVAKLMRELGVGSDA